ncbi:RNA 3'-terminal phosphate cyclase [Mariniblastus fucicola]|uniref:RNA 3'-terminal phosphate cyclase n=1 Tax=Mariniblastus fucicola TaxID=980251 RepID=A0A5B9PB24_9BACT|nr:RNA 3'-terminal phosphate cyclase [Mariniblastus fucicola]QEG23927.1 RNA 3'-terminal phosphate cyclase [Mariniblastus fucicola]
MIEIDGSQGESGGQIVRSSLALSLLTGTPFRIFNLRAGRKKPGLKRQHLTAVNAAAEVGNAIVRGAEIGSREIFFEPGTVSPGDFRFQISTAGSITLVLQTVLPALMMADAPSSLTLSGGTHNMLAPPFDFLERSFVPLLNRMGPQVDLKLNRHGFYPAGGGEFEASIVPAKRLRGLEIVSRGKLLQRRVRAIVSELPIEIARRETARVVRKMNWDRTLEEQVVAADPQGPGNILFAELEYDNLTSVFAGFGQRGVTAENVADAVVRDVRRYLKHDAPVGPHLADQLMLPMAIAAAVNGTPSQFRTGPLTGHSETHAVIIQRFLEVDVVFSESDSGSVSVAIT